MKHNHTQKQHDPERIATAALQMFFNLSDQWDLSVEEERAFLGLPSDYNFNTWKNELTAEELDDETLKRISYLVGIYKSLEILLPSAQSAKSWLRKPNNAPVLSGETALNRILSGSIEDLAGIYRYLDAERHS